MILEHYPSGSALLERAGAFLRARETEHSLLLALAERAVDPAAAPPFFATVSDALGVALVAVRTPPHNIVVSSLRAAASLSDAIDVLVADLSARFGSLPGVSGNEEVALAFGARWATAIGVRARTKLRLTAYELERVIDPPQWPPGSFRVATSDDVEILVDWSHRFIDETGLPEEDRPMAARAAIARRVESGAFRLWVVGGVPVTMAAAGGVSLPRVGPVYTPREQRRRGYASAIVAKLSQEMLDRGAHKVALYADAANPTSNKIYVAVGYRRVGQDVMVGFER